MSAALGKAAARKFMSKQQKKDEEQRLAEGRDPFYYIETNKRGRTKRKPKSSPNHYPQFIPLEDRQRLNSFRKYARMMDTALFGQAGVDVFLGMVPIFGDLASGAIAQQLVARYANKISCGLPKAVYAKMIRNVVIDVGIGFVPMSVAIAPTQDQC